MPHVIAWVVFLVSAAVVVVAGARLARDGDEIAERTGLAAAFVGAILVAAGTSLPEIATTSISVLRGSVGLALGGLFGTIMLNMAMLGVAVLLAGRTNVFGEVSHDQALTASLAIVLGALAAVGIATGDALAVFGVGWTPLAVLAAYLGGVWLLRQGRPPPGIEAGELDDAEGEGDGGSPWPIVVRFVVAAAVILGGSYFLIGAASELSTQLGLGESVFGVALLSIVTALPEASVAFASVLRGAYGIGLGALLGSNAFNIVVLLPLDVLDGPEAILGKADATTAIGLLVGIALMGIVVMGIIQRADRRIGRVDPLAVALIVIWGIGLTLAYRAGAV